MLTRETLLGEAKRRITSVVLPDGRTAFLRSINEAERSRYELAPLNAAGQIVPKKIEESRRLLIVMTLCDEAGVPLLTPADMPALAEVDGATTGVLYDAARKHCGLSGQSVEQLAKNSEATGGAG